MTGGWPMSAGKPRVERSVNVASNASDQHTVNASHVPYRIAYRPTTAALGHR